MTDFLPIPISCGGRSALVVTQAIGKYGLKWKPIIVHNAHDFSLSNGRNVLPPPEWKVVCSVTVLSRPHNRPVLSLVK